MLHLEKERKAELPLASTATASFKVVQLVVGFLLQLSHQDEDNCTYHVATQAKDADIVVFARVDGSDASVTRHSVEQRQSHTDTS